MFVVVICVVNDTTQHNTTMTVKYHHAKTPLQIVVALDVLWWVGWVVSMFVLMFLPDSTGMKEVRLSVIIVAWHVALSYCLLAAWEKVFDHQRVTHVVVFYAIFAFFADMYSVLDAFYHLPSHTPPAAALVTVQVMSTIGTLLSLFGVAVYFALLYNQPPVQPQTKKHHGGDYKDFAVRMR